MQTEFTSEIHFISLVFAIIKRSFVLLLDLLSFLDTVDFIFLSISMFSYIFENKELVRLRNPLIRSIFYSLKLLGR